MRRVRFIPSGGSLSEVTCRTLEGRFFFQPAPWLNLLVVGVLGRAQRLYGVAVHAFVFLSNHFHLMATFSDALQAARFMGFVNSQLARRIRRLRGGHDSVWARRYSLALISAEPEAQVGRLQYLLRQGVKEGLVADPLQWPGPSSWHALASGEPLVGYWLPLGALQLDCAPDFSSPLATREVLHLTPLPAWSHLSDGLQRRQFLQLLDFVRQQQPHCRSQKAPSTAPCDLKPLDLRPRPRPRRLAPLPIVHAASRSVRLLYQEAYCAFVAAYRKASEALKHGVRGVPFPEGCFPRPAPFVSLAAA